MRANFNEKMQFLNRSLIDMGLLIENAISSAIDALVKQDVELAREAIEYDNEIDAKEKEIERLCFSLLLMQHPVAGDLRLISSAMKMITDMERIGDQSADISEITILLSGTPYIKELEHIPAMAAATIKMVNNAVEAFVKKDTSLAEAVIDMDDEVDDYLVTVRNDLIDLVNKKVENCEQAFDLMMIAKYFERIGDHAVNIAEWVLFSITGSKRPPK
ncbi:MAG: phosphate signaling complex protein PhoU [Clostridiales bacterium]|jgi:phosphate transport system protein|nr:phosphate signaling complex protein PhoU [Clostridiales bacterium]